MTIIFITHILSALSALLYGAYLTTQVLRNRSINLQQQAMLLSGSLVTILSGGALAFLMNSNLLHACTNLAVYSALLTAMHIVVFTNKKPAYVLPVTAGLSVMGLLVVM